MDSIEERERNFKICKSGACTYQVLRLTRVAARRFRNAAAKVDEQIKFSGVSIANRGHRNSAVVSTRKPFCLIKMKLREANLHRKFTRKLNCEQRRTSCCQHAVINYCFLQCTNLITLFAYRFRNVSIRCLFLFFKTRNYKVPPIFFFLPISLVFNLFPRKPQFLHVLLTNHLSTGVFLPLLFGFFIASFVNLHSLFSLFLCSKCISTLVLMKKYFAATPMPYIRPSLLYAFLLRGVYCLYC